MAVSGTFLYTSGIYAASYNTATFLCVLYIIGIFTVDSFLGLFSSSSVPSSSPSWMGPPWIPGAVVRLLLGAVDPPAPVVVAHEVLPVGHRVSHGGELWEFGK